jgi:phage portal protein BeeE
VKVWDRLTSARAAQPFWEGAASGAAVFTSSYGSPDREAILPTLAAAGQQAFGTNGVVFAAELQRMLLLAEAEFQFQRLSDKSLFGDPRLAKIERPWPDGTSGELVARMEQDAGWAGNAYIWDAGDQLVRWRPDWVTIISAVTRGPRGPYREKIGFYFEPPKLMQPQYGPPQDVTAAEVVHWAPIPDPQASFRGMSWLTPVLRDAQADTGMTTYKSKYLERAATPNLIIRYTQKLQPGTIDSLRERLAARYGGVDNAYKTLVLDQGADLTPVGNNLREMDFSAVQQAGADRVLAASGVPAVLVGLEPLRGAGRGYQESVVKFSNLWARPQWRSLCAALQKFTPGNDVSAGAVRLWYDTSAIAALQDTETNQAQVSLVRAQALLVLAQAGYTQDSAVAFIRSGDPSQLQGGAAPVALPGSTAAQQHMLPQAPGSGPVPGVKPLPAGSVARLPVGTTSPGDGGNQTRPGRRPGATRRP